MEINSKLASKLALLRADVGGVKKDGKNPHFKSNYVTLEGLLDAIREPLKNNGLEYAHVLTSENGMVFVETYLVDVESGESIKSVAPAAHLDSSTPQQIGSGITYMRRYSLLTMLGLCGDEDDDGNAASIRPIHAPAAPVKSIVTNIPAPASANTEVSFPTESGIQIKVGKDKYWTNSNEIAQQWDELDKSKAVALEYSVATGKSGTKYNKILGLDGTWK